MRRNRFHFLKESADFLHELSQKQEENNLQQIQLKNAERQDYFDKVNKIRKQIAFQYPITNNEINIQPNKLKQIFSNIIEKFLIFNKNIKCFS